MQKKLGNNAQQNLEIDSRQFLRKNFSEQVAWSSPIRISRYGGL